MYPSRTLSGKLNEPTVIAAPGCPAAPPRAGGPLLPEFVHAAARTASARQAAGRIFRRLNTLNIMRLPLRAGQYSPVAVTGLASPRCRIGRHPPPARAVTVKCAMPTPRFAAAEPSRFRPGYPPIAARNRTFKILLLSQVKDSWQRVKDPPRFCPSGPGIPGPLWITAGRGVMIALAGPAPQGVRTRSPRSLARLADRRGKGACHGGNRADLFRPVQAGRREPAPQRLGRRGARHRGGEPGGGDFLRLVPAGPAGRPGRPDHRHRRARQGPGPGRDEPGPGPD